MTRDDLMAAIRAMDTLDAVDLLTDAWEHVSTDADGTDYEALEYVWASNKDGSICPFDALDMARTNLRDAREAERQRQPDRIAELERDYREMVL